MVVHGVAQGVKLGVKLGVEQGMGDGRGAVAELMWGVDAGWGCGVGGEEGARWGCGVGARRHLQLEHRCAARRGASPP